MDREGKRLWYCRGFTWNKLQLNEYDQYIKHNLNKQYIHYEQFIYYHEFIKYCQFIKFIKFVELLKQFLELIKLVEQFIKFV